MIHSNQIPFERRSLRCRCRLVGELTGSTATVDNIKPADWLVSPVDQSSDTLTVSNEHGLRADDNATAMIGHNIHLARWELYQVEYSPA